MDDRFNICLTVHH